MPRVIAIIPVDLERSRLGLPSLAAHRLGDKCVLEHVVDRIARVEAVETIVLLHPAGQQPLVLLKNRGSKVTAHADPAGLRDAYRAMRTAARKWSPHAWRGGLGGMTCYDELLPAAPMIEALRGQKAEAALLVGGDWPLVDSAWCQRVIELHLEQPEAMQMTFTQAPPGLAGVTLGANLLEQLAANPSATLGQLLGYVPTRPQADPIGRDVCVQIPAAIRACARRFIYDTPRSAALIDAVAGKLGERFPSADAALVTQAADELEPEVRAGFGPQQVTIELTPRREATGPIVPQHYVQMNRPPMPLESAIRLVKQAAAAGDVALTLGGLGDALLYKHWDQVVEAAHKAGALGVAIETDLLVPRATLERLLELPVDVVSVRLNADRAALYEQLMGVDRFSNVIGGLQYLFEQRSRREASQGNSADAGGAGVPWLVPRLVKTDQTLEDMEGFFDKWIHYLGHAVIEPATSGCGLMPEQSPVQMEPPRRKACRQIGGRMTVLADGQVARCDQDWLARAPAGDSASQTLTEIWQAMEPLRRAHQAGRWNDLELCANCHEWHRP